MPARSSSVAAVKHAIGVLRCISEVGEPIGVNEIARRVGLHKSSISRLVATLAEERFVERDPLTERIKLGTGLVALAAPVLLELEIKSVVRPALEALANAALETASYSVWDGADAVCVEQAVGPRTVRTFSEPGRRDPGHCTAAGKMLLAHQSAKSIDAYCAAGLKRFNDKTITDPEVLRCELDLARERGYAVNWGELDGDVGALSAAVWDRRGHVAGTVTLTVPIYRFGTDRHDELIALILGAAREISQNLGHRVGGGTLA